MLYMCVWVIKIMKFLFAFWEKFPKNQFFPGKISLQIITKKWLWPSWWSEIGIFLFFGIFLRFKPKIKNLSIITNVIGGWLVGVKTMVISFGKNQKIVSPQTITEWLIDWENRNHLSFENQKVGHIKSNQIIESDLIWSDKKSKIIYTVAVIPPPSIKKRKDHHHLCLTFSKKKKNLTKELAWSTEIKMIRFWMIESELNSKNNAKTKIQNLKTKIKNWIDIDDDDKINVFFLKKNVSYNRAYYSIIIILLSCIIWCRFFFSFLFDCSPITKPKKRRKKAKRAQRKRFILLFGNTKQKQTIFWKKKLWKNTRAPLCFLLIWIWNWFLVFDFSDWTSLLFIHSF